MDGMVEGEECVGMREEMVGEGDDDMVHVSEERMESEMAMMRHQVTPPISHHHLQLNHSSRDDTPITILRGEGISQHLQLMRQQVSPPASAQHLLRHEDAQHLQMMRLASSPRQASSPSSSQHSPIMPQHMQMMRDGGSPAIAQHMMREEGSPSMPHHMHMIREEGSPAMPQHMHMMREEGSPAMPQHMHMMREEGSPVMPQNMHMIHEEGSPGKPQLMHMKREEGSPITPQHLHMIRHGDSPAVAQHLQVIRQEGSPASSQHLQVNMSNSVREEEVHVIMPAAHVEENGEPEVGPPPELLMAVPVTKSEEHHNGVHTTLYGGVQSPHRVVMPRPGDHLNTDTQEDTPTPGMRMVTVHSADQMNGYILSEQARPDIKRTVQ